MMRSRFDLEAGRFYRLIERQEGTTCKVEIEHPAMVRGQSDGPEIQIRVPGDADPKPKLHVELSPGKHELIAVCRDVTGRGVREGSAQINVELKPGEIYQLHADFKAQSKDCDVQVTLLTTPH
jgi:hypothetical protein